MYRQTRIQFCSLQSDLTPSKFHTFNAADPNGLLSVQCLFYNMNGAKRNGATTSFEFVRNWVNTFIKQISISILEAQDEGLKIEFFI